MFSYIDEEFGDCFIVDADGIFFFLMSVLYKKLKKLKS